MGVRGSQTLIVDDGVLGRSSAYALATADASVGIVLTGRRGAGASRAAGAMLGVPGEVTDATARTAHGELRQRPAIEAADAGPPGATRSAHTPDTASPRTGTTAGRS
jgi:glycine oxidase